MICRLLSPAWVFALALVSVPVHASPQDAAEFLTRAELISRIDALASTLAGAKSTQAAAFAGTVPASMQVRVHDATYVVDFSWLQREVSAAGARPDEWPSVLQRLTGRLHAITRELSAGDIVSRPGDPARRAVLERVLAQRAFERARASSWRAELRRRIADWLADLWGRTLGRRIGQRTLALVLAWLFSVAAVVVLLTRIVRSLMRHRRDGPVAIGDIAPPKMAGRELAEQALAHLRAGDAREAAHFAYRAALHRLEEEGVWHVDDARTPREYLRLLPAVNRRRPPIVRLTGAFERIWYGRRTVSAEESRELVTLLQDLECLSPDRAI